MARTAGQAAWEQALKVESSSHCAANSSETVAAQRVRQAFTAQCNNCG
jgi:hypothetical protein